VLIVPARQRLFRTKGGKRAGGHADYMTYPDADASYLVTPHMVRPPSRPPRPALTARQPFALDYHQTLLSLIDVLSELYAKLARVLGPSAAAGSPPGGAMLGPLGPLSPHPGVSYLFDRGASAWDDAPGASAGASGPDSSLWAIAHAGAPANVPLGGAGSVWSPVLGELVLKIDGKLKVRRTRRAGRVLTAATEDHHDAAEGARPVRAERDQRRARDARPAPPEPRGPGREHRLRGARVARPPTDVLAVRMCIIGSCVRILLSFRGCRGKQCRGRRRGVIRVVCGVS
jgi:hypothetical protein